MHVTDFIKISHLCIKLTPGKSTKGLILKSGRPSSIEPEFYRIVSKPIYKAS